MSLHGETDSLKILEVVFLGKAVNISGTVEERFK